MAFVSGIILAAGGSARLGRPKQLLDLDGQPLLTHVIRNAVASSLDEVVLVLGHDAAHIANAVGDWGQRTVVNRDYAAGQSTSLHTGLAAIDPRSDAALFLLGDQPLAGPDVIDAITARFLETGGPIVVPVYDSHPGNPVLISRELFPELARVSGDEGARSVVRSNPAGVVAVPIAIGPPPRDVDTEEDYQALLVEWRRRSGHVATTSAGDERP
jgi:molybdenum cofactor cytidylyltransferase